MADVVANWQAIEFKPPGKDLLEKVRNVLETLVIYLDVLKAILNTIKAFLIDFGNPIKALVEALIKLIRDLIEALKRTGVYGWFDVPDLRADPNFKRHLGGYKSFVSRFKGSLLDTRDLNRPQPVKGALKGGYILIVADAEGPMALLAAAQALYTFILGGFELKPQYLPPANLKVVPVGESGDPILQVTKVFTKQVEALAVEWTLASTVSTADPSLEGLAADISAEFYPPKWLVERSETAPVSEVEISSSSDDGKLRDSSLTGPVTTSVLSSFTDPRAGNRFIPTKIKLLDSYGDPFVKMQTGTVIQLDLGNIGNSAPVGNNVGSFLLGQLGTFRFIDTNVEVGKTYYYRVRAFSGDLDIDPVTGIINFQGPPKAIPNKGKNIELRWPGVGGSVVVMGRASPVIRARLAKIPANFDVMANLRAIFLTAFSLNFHVPLPPPEPLLEFDADGIGVQARDPVTKNPLFVPQFLPNGDPVPPLDVTYIGKGTLNDMGGLIIGLASDPQFNALTPASKYAVDPLTNKTPVQPWQMREYRFQAARLSNRFGSAFLEQDNTGLEGFRQLMQGPIPISVNTSWPEGVGKPQTLEQLVFAFTQVHFTTSTAGAAVNAVVEINPTGNVFLDTARAYGEAFRDATVRKNMVKVVSYLRSFAFQGEPPDWIQVALLRDIFPWSGQYLYDILAKIQALLDAFNGVLEEIKAFIDLLIRKIDALERFIKYLISILDFLATLSLGFYVLNVPAIDGDTSDWMSTVDNAGGAVPPSGPAGYSAGVALAYLAVDITAFKTAFGLIF